MEDEERDLGRGDRAEKSGGEEEKWGETETLSENCFLGGELNIFYTHTA